MTNKTQPKKDFLPELLKFLKRNEKIPILRVSREELNAVCKELEAAREIVQLLRSLLRYKGIRDNFLCYNTGAELIALLEKRDDI